MTRAHDLDVFTSRFRLRPLPRGEHCLLCRSPIRFDDASCER